MPETQKLTSAERTQATRRGDATQEALLKAAQRWPEDGIPHSPRSWLLTVATRVLIDEFRSDTSRRQREDAIFAATPQSELLGRASDSIADPGEAAADRDDSLKLLFLCCHPSLSAPSQIALTLRVVGGLTTAQIAAAFLVPEATMAQRISRAKATIESDGIRFEMPEGEASERLNAVGSSREDAETAGLLALMLLTDARRPARTLPDGALVPLAEQDRTLWTRASIDEGVALISQALPSGTAGPYQLQAAIAAVHDEAPTMDDTDWRQILGLYDLLEKAAPNPMTTLNRAVALAMVLGPGAGLELIASLESDGRMARSH